jgi:hypothetical protein
LSPVVVSERLNVLYEKNWTRLVTEQLKRFERAVVEAGKADGASNPGAPHWTFGGALLYSLTLLTTVGKEISGFSQLSLTVELSTLFPITLRWFYDPRETLNIPNVSGFNKSNSTNSKSFRRFFCRQNTIQDLANLLTPLIHKITLLPIKSKITSYSCSVN